MVTNKFISIILGLLLILLTVGVMSCENEELEEIRKAPEVDFSPQHIISNICVLSDINNQDFFEAYQDGVKLKFVNARYLIPMATIYEIGIPVVEVVSNRIIKVKGDFTSYKNGRIEDYYTRQGNEFVYFPYTGYNSDYEKYIKPLSGIQGTWPYFDGTNTWIYIENRDHQIVQNDYLNFFIPPSNQFSDIYLPEVTQEMTLGEDTLKIQILLSSGENLQIRRNEDKGLGRLQGIQSSKTDEANIALSNRSGNTLYSLAMIPKEFHNIDGYTNYGWQVVTENSNFYQGCLSGYGNGSFAAARKYVELRMFVYQQVDYKDSELNNNFAKALLEFELDRSFNFLIDLPPNTYEFVAIGKDRRGRLEKAGSKQSVIISPMKVTDIIIEEIR